MADATDRYALPLLQTGQAQKEVTHNQAIATIDTLLQLAVEDILTVPPLAPVTGQTWIIAAGATGGWAGRDGRIAAFTSAGWTEITPQPGCMAWVKAAGVFAVFGGASWSVGAWPVRTLAIGGRAVLGSAASPIAAPVGGAVVDAEARATIAAILTGLRGLGLIATG